MEPLLPGLSGDPEPIPILGLGALNHLHRVFDLLRQHRGREVGLATIPRQDKETFAAIQRADTVGVSVRPPISPPTCARAYPPAAAIASSSKTTCFTTLYTKHDVSQSHCLYTH